MSFATQVRVLFSIAAILRIILLIYGEWQDANMVVKYTDVDYLVYHDAARFVTEGASPYARGTYRYSPFLAFLLVPNVWIHVSFGKILFAGLDMAVAYMIYAMLKLRKVKQTMILGMISFWLFNPFVFTVSTRGNADVLIAFLVLGTIYCIVTRRLVLGSILYGAAVHLKIYPIFFVFAILLYLKDNYWGKPSFSYCRKIINGPRVIFGLVSGGFFFLLTAVGLYLYGFEFLYETYIYHLVRKDNRHNFSVYFYQLYLYFDSPSAMASLAAFIPQITLMLVFSIKFYSDLPFCLFLQTITFVAFNKVCTAQYFVWFLSLLPLVIPHTSFTWLKSLKLVVAFFVGELHWLYWGFQLEFKGLSVFLQLWCAGIVFFLANIYIIWEIMSSYKLQKDISKLKIK